MILKASNKLLILKSNKDFFVYNIDNKNKVISYTLTNDLHRHYKHGFNHFKVVNDLQKDILNESFNYSFEDLLREVNIL